MVIDRLRADLSMLMKDFAVVGGALDASTLGSQRLELRRGLYLTGADLQHLAETFEKVTQSVAGFRHNCTLSELHRAKRYSAALRDHCDKLNTELGKD